ncbi:cell division protein FtsQ/DivIB [Streptomyces johnsoniae]|uniref:FtsQ-type POTRA domain-containing protein n=1 Tax=Streptomyces johnsoniae TaxID=3075532 RepID=A0ABU2SE63_9ACTN|nr:FtsQ-type POTRA domain-containing protein [Streptomyces sp. DSM 41886]MDT0447249.1 FtsQ-type POTRA domain-containing protein [Streptomyces sp. DSM 41886]
MAGATTAERDGGRRRPDSGPRPRPPERRSPLARLRPRRPRPRTIVVLVLAVLLGGFGTWALYGSDWLRIERVSVHWSGGQHRLTEEQVLRAAAVPEGSPMASLDKDAVRARLLERLPRLASAEVVRGWPHGVTLKLTERRAEVLMPEDGGFTEVDGDGVPFGRTEEADAGVPLLELELEESASLRRFGEDRIRQEAVSVAAALPDALRGSTRVIRVTSFDSITLELSGDRVVRWGSAEESAAKADALEAVMNAAEDATYFDVSAPSAPAASGG